MKKVFHKTIHPSYNINYDLIIKDIEQNHPIKFPKNSDIIERIYERYPLVSKVEIALVINEIMNSLRFLVLKGHTLSIGFLKNFELHVRKNKDNTKTCKFRYSKEIKNG